MWGALYGKVLAQQGQGPEMVPVSTEPDGLA